MEIIRKTVSFGENDKDLYEFCMQHSENIGVKFATYVKQVLRKEMQNDEPIESIIDKRIAEYLKNKDVKIEEKAITKFEKEDKAALLSFMTKK